MNNNLLQAAKEQLTSRGVSAESAEAAARVVASDSAGTSRTTEQQAAVTKAFNEIKQ